MKNTTKILAVMLTIIAPMLLFAQPDPPSGPVPIDGGLGILLAAGAAYGIKKYKNQKND